MSEEIKQQIDIVKKLVPNRDTLLSLQHHELIDLLSNVVDAVYQIEKLISTESQEDFENRVLATFKPVFDSVPELTDLPLYIWGRYVTDCVGEFFDLSFSSESSNGFSLNRLYKLGYSLSIKKKVLDNVEAVLFNNKMTDNSSYSSSINSYYFRGINKEEYDFYFDSDFMIECYGGDRGGGTMLYIKKDKKGTLAVEVVGCKSPE